MAEQAAFPGVSPIRYNRWSHLKYQALRFVSQLGFKLIRWADTGSYGVAFAQKELDRLCEPGDDMQPMINRDILDIVTVFASQGYSGLTASYVIGMLEKLLRFEPLTPLTGEDDEWIEVGGGMYQNVRCSNVFKDNTGAYDIDGIKWCHNGLLHINNASRVPVTFPYTPTSVVKCVEGCNCKQGG